MGNEFQLPLLPIAPEIVSLVGPADRLDRNPTY